MSFFNRSINKPGPGIEKDEPRKTGIRRFFEICSRDFLDMIKLNLLFCLCAAPSAVLFIISVLGLGSGASLILLILSLAAAAPVGGAVTACFYCITKRMRDDPGFVGFDFKRKLKENFLVAIPAGILCTFVFYMQIYLIIIIAETGGAGIEAWMLFVNVIILVIFGMVLPYIFVQLPYFYLNPGQLLRNSLILFSVNIPRSLMGSVQGGLIWGLFAFFYPFSIFFSPLIVFAAFTMSWLLTLMWIWKPVNERLKIEETIKQQKEENLSV